MSKRKCKACEYGLHKLGQWSEAAPRKLSSGKVFGYRTRECGCSHCNYKEEILDASWKPAGGSRGGVAQPGTATGPITGPVTLAPGTYTGAPGTYTGASFTGPISIPSIPASSVSFVNSTFYGTRTGVIAGEKPITEADLPARKSSDPFVGWKRARLNPYTSKLGGVTVSQWYTIEDSAVCYNNLPHRAPAVDCTCGFYAWKSRDSLMGDEWQSLITFSAFLQVELYGKVIVCENGYRAEKQRVMRMWVPDELESEREGDLSSWYGTEVRRMNELGGKW